MRQGCTKTRTLLSSLILAGVMLSASAYADGRDTIPQHRDEKTPVPAVLDSPVPARVSLPGLSRLESLAGTIEQDSVEAWVRTLEGFGDRLAGSASSDVARDWIYDKFMAMGLDEVRIDTCRGQQLWERPMVDIYNVVATKIGTTQPDKLIVVGGHYDAVPFSPGADDDLSGTVGALSIAAALSEVETEMTIIFVAFACEEGGLWGSRHHAFDLAEQGADVVCMYNMDMIGSVDNFNNANLFSGHETGYASLWAQIADTLVGITGHLAGSAGSDNWGYMWNGYDIVFVEEAEFSAFYHTPGDSAGNMDFDYCTRMIQATMATSLHTANSPDPVRLAALESVGDGQGVSITWHPADAPDLDHYVLYWDSDPSSNLDSTTLSSATTEATVNGLTENQLYRFAVRAVDTDGNVSLALDWQYCMPTITIPQFTKILEGWPAVDGSESFGVSMVDVNNDDYLDLYVTNWSGFYTRGNRLYINDTEGGFTRVFNDTIVTHHSSSPAASLGDVDSDGDIDAGVFNSHERSNWVFLNNGSGQFEHADGIGLDDSLYAYGGSWADYDNDGDLDMFVANLDRYNAPSYAGQNFLYRNDGGTFTRILSGSVATDLHDSYCGVWCDYDNDGDQDVLVTNLRAELCRLHRNDGGSFTVVTAGALTANQAAWRGASWADYDNDGNFDVLVTDYDGSATTLYRNGGDGTFSAIPLPVTGGAQGSAWGDYDNDGDLDLFVSAGDLSNPYLNKDVLYRNNNDGYFSQVTGSEVSWEAGHSNGAAWGDYDNDGDLDLFVARAFNLHNNLYRNNGNDNHWLNVRCEGTASNRSGVGARLSVKATIGGSPRWQHREVSTQTGFSSQSSLRPHFGLGDATVVDSLTIRWPSGTVDVYENLPVDKHFVATEGFSDLDNDGVETSADNCPYAYNPGQEDYNGDGVGDACCCGHFAGGRTGNANCSADGKLTLSDITALIDHVFISKQPLCCETAGNIDGDSEGLINLQDITRLIDHNYISKALTAACQ